MKKPSIGRVLWSCILPILIFLGVDTVISFVAMFVISFIETFKAGSAAMSDFATAYNDIMNSTMDIFMKYALYFTAIRSAIVIPVFFVLMNKRDKKEMREGTFVRYEKFNKWWLLIIVPLGITSCFGFNELVVMIAELAQSFINYIIETFNLGIEYDIFGAFNETNEIIYSGGLVLQILVTCVGAPLAEELLFRGLVHKNLRKVMNMVPAMLISSLLFGIIHGNIIQCIYASLIGLICAFVYEKFKTIWAPIILHATANSFAVISTFLMPGSGSEIEGEGLGLGGYVLYTVIMLSITVGLMLLIEKKVNRKEIQ